MLSEIFFTFLKLGITAFGGPAAHLGFFRQEFVEKRKWLTDQQYAELLSICQIIPGPASSQVGLCLGLLRGGYLGAFIAFFAFTLPSVLLLLGFAIFSTALLDNTYAYLIISALKILAFMVVSQAVFTMFTSFCKDTKTLAIALLSALMLVFLSNAFVSIIVISASMIFAIFSFKDGAQENSSGLSIDVKPIHAKLCLTTFVFLLLVLPFVTDFSLFYQAGAFVFGGGHVVLPLLKAPLVDSGILSPSIFMSGYGATQLVPGPIFTFAAYLGYMLPVDGGFSDSSWLNTLIATILLFLPGFLLVLAILPYWQKFNQYPKARKAIAGASAAVVGILLASLINPIGTSAITSPLLALLCLMGLALIMKFKLKLWHSLMISVLISISNALLLG